RGKRTGNESAGTSVALLKMNGVVNARVRSQSVERQIFHLLVSRIELKCKILIRVIRAEMRAARSELGFSEPELANRHDSGKFEPILPNIAIHILAVVAAPADSAARDDALRKKMKRARAKRAGGTGKKRVFPKIRGHVVAVPLPLIP